MNKLLKILLSKLLKILLSKLLTILLSIMGGCYLLMELLTPIAIVILWCFYFNASIKLFILLLCLGGLASVFRGIKTIWGVK